MGAAVFSFFNLGNHALRYSGFTCDAVAGGGGGHFLVERAACQAVLTSLQSIVSYTGMGIVKLIVCL